MVGGRKPPTFIFMKQVFAKIAKIGEEVRSAEPMKVEFDAVSDSRKYLEKTKDIVSKIDSLDAEFNKLTSDARKLLNAAIKVHSERAKLEDDMFRVVKEFSSAYDNYEAKAKELGFDIKQTPLFKAYEDASSLALTIGRSPQFDYTITGG